MFEAAHVPLFPPHRYPGVSGTYIDIVKDVVDIAAVHMSADKFVSWMAYITVRLTTKVHDVASVESH